MSKKIPFLISCLIIAITSFSQINKYGVRPLDMLLQDCFYGENRAIMLRFLKAHIFRNAGIRKSKGEYITFLDADDLWPKGKLRKQVELMEGNKEVLIYSQNNKKNINSYVESADILFCLDFYCPDGQKE